MAFKRGHKKRHGERGESAFVSMTDLTVSFLFIVLVLLAFFAIHFRPDAALGPTPEELWIERDNQKERVNSLTRKTERLKRALSESTRENVELEQEIMELEQEINQLRKTSEDPMPRDLLAEYLKEVNSVRKDLLQNLGERIRQRVQGIRVEVVTRDGLIRFRGDDLFRSGEWRIKSGSIAEEVAHVIADALIDILPCYTLKGPNSENRICTNSEHAAFETIQIEGHTDDVPLSENLRIRENMRDNLDLSARRGAETLRSIEKHQPELKNFRNLRDEQVLSFAGYGDTRPIERDDSDDARAANRRIDIRFILQNPQNLQEVEEIRALIRKRQNLQRMNFE